MNPVIDCLKKSVFLLLKLVMVVIIMCAWMVYSAAFTFSCVSRIVTIVAGTSVRVYIRVGAAG
jgi:hypothetical protein